MNKEVKQSNYFWYLIVGIIFVMILVASIGFVAFSNREDEVIEKNSDGAKVYLNYSSDIPGLKLTNMTPTSNDVSMNELKEGYYFDFSVEVDMLKAKEYEYEISVVKDSNNSSIVDDDVRVYLEKEDSGSYVKVFEPNKYSPLKKKSDLGSPKGSMVLYTESCSKDCSNNYRLRIWLSDSSTVTIGSYGVDVIVNGVAK